MNKASFYRTNYPAGNISHYTIVVGVTALFVICTIALYSMLPYLRFAVKETLSALNFADCQAMLALNFKGSAATDRLWYRYAVRHNKPDGSIIITVSANSFSVANIGKWNTPTKEDGTSSPSRFSNDKVR